MIKKVSVAVGIFTVMFISAWWANEINEKRYYIDEPSEQIEIFMVEEEEEEMFERFRPREYIKVKR